MVTRIRRTTVTRAAGKRVVARRAQAAADAAATTAIERIEVPRKRRAPGRLADGGQLAHDKGTASMTTKIETDKL